MLDEFTALFRLDSVELLASLRLLMRSFFYFHYPTNERCLDADTGVSPDNGDASPSLEFQ